MVGNAVKNQESDDQAPANNLQQIREAEGLAKAKLARQSDVSVDIITDAETRRRRLRPESQNRIVNGLNRIPNKQREYTVDNVFPNG